MEVDSRRSLTRLFGATVFLGAVLLFQLELIVAKTLLPWFGGSPAVWTRCLVFFQVVLLAAYLYTHLLIIHFPVRRQVALHAALLALSLTLLVVRAIVWPSPLTPGSSRNAVYAGDPTASLFVLLFSFVGLPLFFLAATAPLLQAWFIKAGTGTSPYRLYGLSNAGSMAGLLSYPLLVEPFLSIPVQGFVWSSTYLLYAAGILACAAPLWSRSMSMGVHGGAGSAKATKTGHRSILLWAALAAAPTALLLATTNHMCQDTGVVPLLWVLPLSLYLGSFILCFHSDQLPRRWLFPSLFALSIGGAVIVLFIGLDSPLLVQIGVDASMLFTGCMTLHAELARSRPGPSQLTMYYLSVAVGGAAGGLCVALVAPHVFPDFWEYHLGLVSAFGVFLLALVADSTSMLRTRPIMAGVPLGLFLTGIGVALIVQSTRLDPDTRYRERNFYGVLRVTGKAAEHYVELDNGRVMHGFQYEEPEYAGLPTSYYSEESGIGLAIAYHPRRDDGLRIGVVGLGVGTIASYCGARDTICFYEINPAVQGLSQGQHPFFTYVRDCAGTVEIKSGDARLVMEEELRMHEQAPLDLLAIDAFSGDAIPVHLLTKEAFDIYLGRLRDDSGIIAVNITNRYLNLIPVIRGVAQAEGLSSALIQAKEDDDGGLDSDWIVLSRSPSFFTHGPVAEALTPWDSVDAGGIRCWTDDFSNLLEVLKK